MATINWIQNHPRRRRLAPNFQNRARRLCTNLKFRKVKIAVLLTTDRQIARLHRRFLRQTGPTDVMTFAEPGEIAIAISLNRAEIQGRPRGVSLWEECTLLIAHGLLHAKGLKDKTLSEQLNMRQAEFALLAKSL